MLPQVSGVRGPPVLQVSAPFHFPAFMRAHAHGSNYKSPKENQCPEGILHSCSLKQPRTNWVINW